MTPPDAAKLARECAEKFVSESSTLPLPEHGDDALNAQEEAIVEELAGHIERMILAAQTKGVQRYRIEPYGDKAYEDDQGKWVKYEDILALSAAPVAEAEHEEVEAARTLLVAWRGSVNVSRPLDVAKMNKLFKAYDAARARTDAARRGGGGE